MNNSFTAIGHVGKTITTVEFPDSGKKVVKFSVAIKEFSANGEKPKTMWVDCDAWNGIGDRVLKTITKGREVLINGRLSMSQYTKDVDGQQHQIIKPVIRLTSFHLCGKKPQDAATQAENNESEE